MDRLVFVEPSLANLEIDDDAEGSSVTVTLNNVLYTMPVAFKVQPMIPNKYSIKPALGLIPPLGTATLEISLLDSAKPRFSVDGFEVKTVVVATGSSSKNKWFAPKKRVVYTDESLKVAVLGGSVFRQAVARGAVDEAREVLERNPSSAKTVVNSRTRDGLTALHMAVRSQSVEMVQLILENGAEIDRKSRDLQSQSPLVYAAVGLKTIQSEIISLLLDQGADPNSSDSNGWRTIHHAVNNGHVELLRLLLQDSGKEKKSTDVNAPIGDGRTALHLAVISGDLVCVRMLMENGADVTARTVDGKTALHLAATQGQNVGIAKLLLAWGAERDAVDWQGRTAHDEAVELGQETLFQILEVGRDDHNEGLRYAAWRGDMRALKRFVKRGASVNAKDHFGWTALHCAAFKGHCEVVKRLVGSLGADPGAMNEEGHLPLHCAVESGHRDVLRVLAGFGDVNAPSGSGLNALDMALALKDSAIVHELVKAGAKSSTEEKQRNL